MKYSLQLLISIFLVFLISCSNTHDTKTKDLVAVIYALAISQPDAVPEYVKSHKNLFAESSDFYNCIDDFSNALKESAIKSPSRNEIYDQAMKIAGDAGMPEMGSKIADDMSRSSGDMIRLASYLQQIKNSMPGLINGNSRTYASTELYQMSSYIWQMSSNLLLPQQVQSIREMMYRLSYWYVSNLITAV